MKRYLILAEGYVTDAHYGKTMRGVLNYGSDEVVALLDSEHAGETLHGLPVVGSVADALGYEPDTALVGVATSGGRLPEVWQAILQLPPRQRAAIVLRFYEDLSERESAEILGCSVGALNQLVARATTALRDRFGKDER